MKRRFYRFPDPNDEPGSNINFDALGQPDTGPASVDFASLPDMTQQIKNQLNLNNPPAPPPNPPGTPPGTPLIPNPLEWVKPYEGLNQKIKEKFTDFELPADIKPENYVDTVMQFIESKYQKPQLDPVIEQLNNEIAKGIPVDKVISQYQEKNNFFTMSPEQRMFVHMKNEIGRSEENPNGLDDEAIRDRVNKLKDVGMLELQDKQIRDSYQQKMESQNQQQQQKAYEKYIADFQYEEVEREKVVDAELQNISKLDNIAGIPLSQSDKQEFTDTFKFIVKRNPNDGLSILDALLQSNDFLMKAVYLGLRAEPKIRAAITEAKEGVKKNIIEKLDKNPDLNRGQNLTGNPLQIDYDAMVAPESN